MASLGKALLISMVSCATGDAALRGSLANTSSADVSSDLGNTTSTEDASSFEDLQDLPISNFAVSQNGCNIKCVYADWARGTCHGTTCVCSGLKSSQPQALPNTCQVPERSSGQNSCNIVCVYSDWFRGRCNGPNQCICSGGKSSQPQVLEGDYMRSLGIHC